MQAISFQHLQLQQSPAQLCQVTENGCQQEEQQCTPPQGLLRVMKEEIWLREYLITTVTARADLQVPSQSLLAETYNFCK